jgi:hypothetical protein
VQQSLQAAAFYYIIYLGRISVPLRKPQKGGDVLARTRNRKTALFYLGGNIMEQIVSIIQTVGFPIACAIAMFIMLNNEQKQHKEESEKLTATITDLKVSFQDAINQQKTDMVTALNNNTLVLQKLIDKMDGK